MVARAVESVQPLPRFAPIRLDAAFDLLERRLPPAPSQREVLATLDALRVPTRLDEALDWLERWQANAEILSLYLHYFPDEWAKSTASDEPHGVEVYSDREWEFFNLVHRHLFPLNEMWLEEGGLNDDERSGQIPVDYGYWGWQDGNEEVRDVRPGWKLLVVLSSQLWDGELDRIVGDDPRADLPEKIYRQAARAAHDWAGIGVGIWRVTCRVNGAPEILLALPDAISMLNRDTYTFFLDAMEMAEVDFPWSIEDIDYLRDDWSRAKAILARVDPLLEWLEQPANARLLIRLYREARRTVEKGGYPLSVVLTTEAA